MPHAVKARLKQQQNKKTSKQQYDNAYVKTREGSLSNVSATQVWGPEFRS